MIKTHTFLNLYKKKQHILLPYINNGNTNDNTMIINSPIATTFVNVLLIINTSI